MAVSDEPVEVVDVQGRVRGLATRAEMRAANLRHRAVYVVVLTSTGAVVVHRRADWKDVWPGRWDLAFGGVVAPGEPWAEAARRELAEEAGVAVDVGDLRDLGQGAFTDDDAAVVGRTYLVEHDGPFTCPDGEVAEVATVPFGELGAWLAARDVCADTRALVVPRLLAAPRTTGSAGGPHPIGGLGGTRP